MLYPSLVHPVSATLGADGTTITVSILGSGTTTITVTATDQCGSSTVLIRFIVSGGNQSPVTVGTITNRAIGVGQTTVVYDIDTYFSDPDDDELTYSVVSSDSNVVSASISGTNLNIASSQTAIFGTDVPITVTATDPDLASASQTFFVLITFV